MMKNNEMMKKMENGETVIGIAMSRDHRTPVSVPQVHSVLD